MSISNIQWGLQVVKVHSIPLLKGLQPHYSHLSSFDAKLLWKSHRKRVRVWRNDLISLNQDTKPLSVFLFLFSSPQCICTTKSLILFLDHQISSPTHPSSTWVVEDSIYCLVGTMCLMVKPGLHLNITVSFKEDECLYSDSIIPFSTSGIGHLKKRTVTISFWYLILHPLPFIHLVTNVSDRIPQISKPTMSSLL